MTDTKPTMNTDKVLALAEAVQQELEVQMVGWSDCEEKLTKAEERNKQLVELLKEAQKWLCLQNDFNSQNCAKRIDAELLREVGK